jgi:hypothetical protein
MLGESITNSRKYHLGYNILDRIQIDSSKKSAKRNSHKEILDNFYLNRKDKNKVYLPRKGISPLKTAQVADLLPVVHNKFKPSTPGNSIQIFDLKKVLVHKKITDRPISVGGKNFRPGFLEPEVVTGHFPNKSALIGSYASANQSKNNEAYKFPLFRTKKNLGFKLSISPESSEAENSFSFIQQSYSKEALKVSKTQRIPMSVVTRVSGKPNEMLLNNIKSLDYGYKND